MNARRVLYRHKECVQSNLFFQEKLEEREYFSPSEALTYHPHLNGNEPMSDGNCKGFLGSGR